MLGIADFLPQVDRFNYILNGDVVKPITVYNQVLDKIER